MERPAMSWRRSISKSHRSRDRGFTLVEVLISLVLSGLIAGVVVAVILTSLNAADSTSAEINDSNDAALISSFLIRDAQSAGGINPGTALPDVALGVSNAASDAAGIACTPSPATVTVRFSWLDRSTSPRTRVVTTYSTAADPANSLKTQFIRRVCSYDDTNGTRTSTVDVLLGQNILSAAATCQPAACAGHPDSVTLTVEGKGTRAPLVSVLTASLRSAASQLMIIGPQSLPDGQLNADYPEIFMTTIGAVPATSWEMTGQPAGLSIDRSTGIISGRPTEWGRLFEITITVRDAASASATKVYKDVVVQAPPVANSDSYEVNEDTTLTVAAPGVLGNDTKANGARPATAVLYTGVANGALTFTSDGSFIYTPRSNFNGTDSFQYKAKDGLLTSITVTVTITVNAVNDAPVNRVPVAQHTAKNTGKMFTNSSVISISDVDAGSEGVQVTLTATNGTMTLPGATNLTFLGGDGTADQTMTFTGAIADINRSLVAATFTPDTDFTGAAAVEIATYDQGHTGIPGPLGDTDSVAITVTGANGYGDFTDDQAVGQEKKDGLCLYEPGRYTVQAGQGRIEGTSDQFRFCSRAMTGDGSLTAQVVDFSATGNGDAQAGVMFRESLDPGSSHATMDLMDGNQAEFLYRRALGGATSSSTSPGTRGLWVRLTRVGNVITAGRSVDGVNWTRTGQQTIAMSPTIYIGLAVSAHSNSVSSATFENVSIGTSPTAIADSYSVNEDSTLIVDTATGVLANDSDSEGGVLNAVIVTGTAGLTLNQDGSLTYVPPPNFSGTVSFTYMANNAMFNSTPVSVTIAVNPANETPSFTKGADQRTDSNLGPQSILGWATAISPGAGETGQLIDFVTTNDNNALFSVQPSVGAEGTLSYAPAVGVSGAATVSVSIHDNGGTANGGIDTSLPQTIVIIVDNAPVVTSTVTAMSYVENGTTLLDSGVTVTDADSANLTAAAVAIATNYVNGQDTLAFANQNGITGVWTPATGVLTLNGSSSVANYEAALRSITYNNNSDNPSTATRTVAFVATDGLLDSAVANRTITITATNDAPVLTATAGSMAYTENGTAGVDPAITVTDADSVNLSSATVTMTNYLNGQDTLGFTTQNGITGSWSASGVLTLSGSSTVANYQAALRAITYNNNSDNPGIAIRTVTFVVSDGTASSAASRAINVAAVNDAPVNGVPGAQVTPRNVAEVFSSANASLISVSDADAGSSSVQVQLVSTSGLTTLSGNSGLTFVAGDGTADATMTFTGAVSAANAALSGLSFNPTNNFLGAASLKIVSNDLGNTGSGGAQSDTDTITIIVDTAPVVTAVGGTTTYTENTAATLVDAGVTVADGDSAFSANLVSATANITSGYVSGLDTLAFTSKNGISGVWNASTGTLTMSGSSTIANYQTALRSVTFITTGDNPSTTARTVSFAVNDGLLGSNTSSRTVAIAAVNDLPVNVFPGSQSIPRNTSRVLTFSISDVDAGSGTMQVQLVSVKGTTTLSGIVGLAFSAGDGTADQTMTFTGSITDINAALSGLRFNAGASAGGGSLKIVTSDQGNTGSGGAKTDTDTVTITVT
jgi:prepilin-type N-terminal cleavage/methylation domain-containing protein